MVRENVAGWAELIVNKNCRTAPAGANTQINRHNENPKAPLGKIMLYNEGYSLFRNKYQLALPPKLDIKGQMGGGEKMGA